VGLNSSLGLGLELRGKDAGATAVVGAVKRGLSEVTKEAKGAKAALDQVGKKGALGASGGVNHSLIKMHENGMKAREQVQGLFEDVGKIGKGVAAGGLLGGAGLFGAAAKSGDLTDALAGLKSVSGATAEEMALLKKTSLDMGLSTNFVADQVSTALTDISSAGFNARESMDLLKPSLDLATASLGQLSSSDAAALTAQSLKAFGMEATDARPAVDKLVKTMNLFAVQAKDLPLGLANSVRGAKALNQSMDETLVSFGLVKNIIPRVETAATAVSVAMERMVSTDTQKELKKLGTEVIDPTTKKFRPFLDIVSDMAPALDKMGETKASAFLQDTFGPEALTGINAILTQMRAGIKTATGETLKGGAALSYLRTQMAQSKGTAEAFANELNAGLPGVMRQIKAAGMTFIEVLGEPVGEAIRPGAEAVLSVIRSMAAGLRSIPKESQVMIARIAVIVTMLATLSGSLLAARASWGIFAAGMQAARATAILASGSFLPIIVVIGGVVAALAAFKYAVDHNIGSLGDYFKGGAQDVKRAVETMRQLFTTGGLSGDIRKAFHEGGDGAVNFGIKVWLLANRLQNFGRGVMDGFGAAVQRLRPVFLDLADQLERIGIAFGDMDPKKNKAAFDGARSSGVALGEALGQVAGLVVKLVTAGVKLAIVIGQIGDKVAWVVGKLGGMETVIKLVELALVRMAAQRVIGGMGGLATSIAGVGTAAASAAKGMFDVSAGVDAIDGKMSTATKSAGRFAGGLSSVRAGLNSTVSRAEAAQAAIIALYLAYDQLQELGKEAEVDVVDAAGKKVGKSDGYGEMWRKFQNDIGFMSDEEYARSQGIHSGVKMKAGGMRLGLDERGREYMYARDGVRMTEDVANWDADLRTTRASGAAVQEIRQSTAYSPMPSMMSRDPAASELKSVAEAGKTTEQMRRETAQMERETAMLNRETAEKNASSSSDMLE
jgi:TP901 family phage tail tape measure protein